VTFTLTRRHVVGGLAVATLPLRAWANNRSALTFLAVGDWGRDGAFHQQDVADRMGETAADIGASFVISVGDNFYEDGVKSVDDPIWKSSFEDVYRAPSLQAPWYVMLGNHDYHGNAQAQLDYSAKSPRWRLPARWYAFKQTAPDGATVEFFVLDTSPFIKKYYADGGAKVKVVGQNTQEQLAWFEQALAASKADWKIVVGHHPVYSGRLPAGQTAPAEGESVPGGSPELIALIDPILQRHRVPLYLNGHDHDLQHVRRGVTDYVCTGAGSKTRNHCDMDGSDFCSLSSGFVACSIDRDRLHLVYRDHAGADLHVVEIPHARAA
jgi:acid phosphatase